MKNQCIIVVTFQNVRSILHFIIFFYFLIMNQESWDEILHKRLERNYTEYDPRCVAIAMEML